MSKSKKHKKKQKQKRKNITHKSEAVEVFGVPSLEAVAEIAESRSGGAISIHGFVVQCKYATWRVLDCFRKKDEFLFVSLEGVEDIDLIKIHKKSHDAEYLQVKYSINKMNAAGFWANGFLQNCAEVYIKDPTSKFRFVHNMDFSDGHLKNLLESSAKGISLKESTLNHWIKKIEEFKQTNKAKDWDWSSFDVASFLKTVQFERISEISIDKQINRLVVEDYGIVSGNERQYIKALHWFVLDSSRRKESVNYKRLVSVVEEIKEDISKGSVNPAISKRWIEPVIFSAESETPDLSYFEGKAARPSDIAKGLPVRRKDWEKELKKAFEESDVTVIRASSGQGKSTLAWQLASEVKDQGWSPYELRWCGAENDTGDLEGFLESRLRIGQLPLIIIDGLRAEVAAWAELADRTKGTPVKYIITTREEDWYRFGADRSKLRLRPVSIDMSIDEAEKIFWQFRKAGKLHSDIQHWQPAWEQVSERGLLIEYVFLLTQGEMIEERLSFQIKQLKDESDGKVKIEVLRLVSTANSCNAKIITSKLIDSVSNRIGFVGDRGDCLASLQKEYYIQIEDKMFIEGLHPIRSKHLLDILHETLPVGDSLVNLLPIIDENDVYEFCAKAPLLVADKQRPSFLKQLADDFSVRSYNEMNRAIDGLFSTDAFQNWFENKDVYDNFYSQGAGIFAADTVPWSQLKVLERLAETLEGSLRKNIESHLENLKKLNPFEPEKSNTLQFIEFLSKHLVSQDLKEDYIGLGRLTLWFNRFGRECPAFLKVDESIVWGLLSRLNIGEAGELFTACYVVTPNLYNEIIENRKSEIVGYLKKQTRTLSIEEKGEDLSIEYLIDYETSVSINDQSVNRINVMRSFFPGYERYCSQGLQPPLPILVYLDNPDESFKQMPAENVFDVFTIHINQTWMDRITAIYDSQSVYEWQKQWIDIRTKSLELANASTKYFEEGLQGRDQKNVLARLNSLRPLVINLLTTKKDFPRNLDKTFKESKFKKEIRDIEIWSSHWRNFLEQMNSFTGEDESSRLLANHNMQDVRRQLGIMQDAYDYVANKTFPYFDVSHLRKEETISYGRLAKTSAFLWSNTFELGKVLNPKMTISQWWNSLETNRHMKLEETFSKIGKQIETSFIFPSHTEEKGSLLRAVIGVRGFSWSQIESKADPLLGGMLELVDLDIDQYLIIPIVDNVAEKRRGISIYKRFLENLKKSIEEGTEFDLSQDGKPLPEYLDEDSIASLEGISLPDDEQSQTPAIITNILTFLWQLTEARKRLSSNLGDEKDFLAELENEFKQKLTVCLVQLKNENVVELEKKYSKYIDRVLDKNEHFTSDMLEKLALQDIS